MVYIYFHGSKLDPNPIKIHDLGGFSHIFLETPIYIPGDSAAVTFLFPNVGGH